MARDMAERLNRGDGEELLKPPEPHILDDVAVVPGTDGRKMSKTYGNTIELFASDKQVKKAIMRIVTDSATLEDSKDPGACNVYHLLELFCDATELAEVAELYRAGGVGYGEFKQRLLQRFHERFDAARARREQLAGDLGYVGDVLEAGASRARELGRPVLEGVQSACGLRA